MDDSQNEYWDAARDSDESDPAFVAELRELADEEAFRKAHIRIPIDKGDAVVEPLQDRVILRITHQPGTLIRDLASVTDLTHPAAPFASIVIPDKYRSNARTGEVIAVGPGAIRKKDGVRVPLTLSVGDRVIYHELGGQEYEAGVCGEYRYRVIRERDCLALIT